MFSQNNSSIDQANKLYELTSSFMSNEQKQMINSVPQLKDAMHSETVKVFKELLSAEETEMLINLYKDPKYAKVFHKLTAATTQAIESITEKALKGEFDVK
jgi:hypothetical protein